MLCHSILKHADCAALSTSGNDEVLLLLQSVAEKLYLVVTRMLICELLDMLLSVFEEINFTAFFRWKIWDQKVNKNDLNFNKQYI